MRGDDDRVRERSAGEGSALSLSLRREHLVKMTQIDGRQSEFIGQLF